MTLLQIKEMEKMNLEKLQAIVKEGIHLSEVNGRYYAVSVEDNGDEHDLAQANNVEDLHEQLKNFGQIA